MRTGPKSDLTNFLLNFPYNKTFIETSILFKELNKTLYKLGYQKHLL